VANPCTPAPSVGMGGCGPHGSGTHGGLDCHSSHLPPVGCVSSALGNHGSELARASSDAPVLGSLPRGGGGHDDGPLPAANHTSWASACLCLLASPWPSPSPSPWPAEATACAGATTPGCDGRWCAAPGVRRCTRHAMPCSRPHGGWGRAVLSRPGRARAAAPQDSAVSHSGPGRLSWLARPGKSCCGTCGGAGWRVHLHLFMLTPRVGPGSDTTHSGGKSARSSNSAPSCRIYGAANMTSGLELFKCHKNHTNTRCIGNG